MQYAENESQRPRTSRALVTPRGLALMSWFAAGLACVPPPFQCKENDQCDLEPTGQCVMGSCEYTATAGSTETSGGANEPVTQEDVCFLCMEQAFACSCNVPSMNGWQPSQYGCNQMNLDEYANDCRTALGKTLDPPAQLFDWEFNCNCVECVEDTSSSGVPTTGETPTTGESSTTDDSTTGGAGPVCLVGEALCTGWDPDSNITFSSGVYYVNISIVADLLADPRPLRSCDDARFLILADPPGFELADADDGEMLYELGLRDGDIPLELNGLPLATAGDVVEAVGKLWWEEAETEYELYVLRGTTYVTLEYSVGPML